MSAPVTQGESLPQPHSPSHQPWVTEATVIQVERMPRDYVLCSLFSTLFLNTCCVGFVALIYSFKARDCKVSGDLQGATRHANTSKTLNIIALIVSIVVLAIILVVSILTGYKALMHWNNTLWTLSQLTQHHKIVEQNKDNP